MAHKFIWVCSALLAIPTTSAMNITSFTQFANLTSGTESIMEGGSIELSCGVDRKAQDVGVGTLQIRLSKS